jgi:hypothetical protein
MPRLNTHISSNATEDIRLQTVFRVLHGMRDLPRRLIDPPGAE